MRGIDTYRGRGLIADPIHRYILYTRPDGVAGITVVSYVGAEKSENPADYTLQGVTSRPITDVNFPASVEAGATVWISAYYFNPRCQAGVAAVPVGTNLQGGSLEAA